MICTFCILFRSLSRPWGSTEPKYIYLLLVLEFSIKSLIDLKLFLYDQFFPFSFFCIHNQLLQSYWVNIFFSLLVFNSHCLCTCPSLVLDSLFCSIGLFTIFTLVPYCLIFYIFLKSLYSWLCLTPLLVYLLQEFYLSWSFALLYECWVFLPDDVIYLAINFSFLKSIYKVL